VIRPLAVLVGPPGAGKTTIGTALAQALGRPFRDTDADIEQVAGKPIPEIFFDEGEEYFRTLEKNAVAAALAEHGGILALGGGAVLAPQTREALRGHTVIYLSVELADAVSRTGMATSRPLLAINPRATLKAMLDARRPLYEEVATIVVKTDGRGPEEITAELLDALAG
jgi:shikimate kinase